MKAVYDIEVCEQGKTTVFDSATCTASSFDGAVHKARVIIKKWRKAFAAEGHGQVALRISKVEMKDLLDC